MSWESDILNLTYLDKMNVSRMVKEVDPISKATKRVPKLIGENILCALSKKDLPVLDGETNNIVARQQIFCRPEIDIQAGDILTVASLGRTYTLVAGIPFLYSSHQEIPVSFKERV